MLSFEQPPHDSLDSSIKKKKKKKRKGQPCITCPASAAIYCIDCDSYLCENCDDTLHRALPVHTRNRMIHSTAEAIAVMRAEGKTQLESSMSRDDANGVEHSEQFPSAQILCFDSDRDIAVAELKENTDAPASSSGKKKKSKDKSSRKKSKKKKKRSEEDVGDDSRPVTAAEELSLSPPDTAATASMSRPTSSKKQYEVHTAYSHPAEHASELPSRPTSSKKQYEVTNTATAAPPSDSQQLTQHSRPSSSKAKRVRTAETVTEITIPAATDETSSDSAADLISIASPTILFSPTSTASLPMPTMSPTNLSSSGGTSRTSSRPSTASLRSALKSPSNAQQANTATAAVTFTSAEPARSPPTTTSSLSSFATSTASTPAAVLQSQLEQMSQNYQTVLNRLMLLESQIQSGSVSLAQSVNGSTSASASNTARPRSARSSARSHNRSGSTEVEFDIIDQESSQTCSDNAHSAAETPDSTSSTVPNHHQLNLSNIRPTTADASTLLSTITPRLPPLSTTLAGTKLETVLTPELTTELQDLITTRVAQALEALNISQPTVPAIAQESEVHHNRLEIEPDQDDENEDETSNTFFTAVDGQETGFARPKTRHGSPSRINHHAHHAHGHHMRTSDLEASLSSDGLITVPPPDSAAPSKPMSPTARPTGRQIVPSATPLPTPGKSLGLDYHPNSHLGMISAVRKVDLVPLPTASKIMNSPILRSRLKKSRKKSPDPHKRTLSMTERKMQTAAPKTARAVIAAQSRYPVPLPSEVQSMVVSSPAPATPPVHDTALMVLHSPVPNNKLAPLHSSSPAPLPANNNFILSPAAPLRSSSRALPRNHPSNSPKKSSKTKKQLLQQSFSAQQLPTHLQHDIDNNEAVKALTFEHIAHNDSKPSHAYPLSHSATTLNPSASAPQLLPVHQAPSTALVPVVTAPMFDADDADSDVEQRLEHAIEQLLAIKQAKQAKKQQHQATAHPQLREHSHANCLLKQSRHIAQLAESNQLQATYNTQPYLLSHTLPATTSSAHASVSSTVSGEYATAHATASAAPPLSRHPTVDYSYDTFSAEEAVADHQLAQYINIDTTGYDDPAHYAPYDPDAEQQQYTYDTASSLQASGEYEQEFEVVTEPQFETEVAQPIQRVASSDADIEEIPDY